MTGTPSKDRAEVHMNRAARIIETMAFDVAAVRRGDQERAQRLIASCLATSQDEGFAEGMKRAAEICAEVEAAYLEPEYTTDQPLGSIAERCACRSCSTHILAEIEER